MPKLKVLICRSAIIEEYYEIEADSEEQALEIAYDGGYGEPVHTEFVDWRDDEWTVSEVQIMEPLYKMIKDYQCDTTS